MKNVDSAGISWYTKLCVDHLINIHWALDNCDWDTTNEGAITVMYISWHRI